MPAKTTNQVKNGNILPGPVLDRLKAYFKVQFANEQIYVDTDRTQGVLLSLFVKEKEWQSRINVQIEILTKVFPSDDKIMPSYKIAKGEAGGGASSLGAIIVGEYSPGRYVRIALRVHGQASAGIKNEDEFVNNINHYINQGRNNSGSITIQFVDKNRKIFTRKNITKAVSVGQQRKRKVDDDKAPELFPKSDVDLIDTNKDAIPISIKQADAEFWASVETWFYHDNARWGTGADWYMRQAHNQKDIPLMIMDRVKNGKFKNLMSARIDPKTKEKVLVKQKVQLVWKADKRMRTVAAFGSDIQKKNPSGCIVKKTFSRDDFEEVVKDGENILRVRVDEIIRDETDLGDDVFILCYYSADRGSQSNVAKGIRVSVATRSRAIGKYGTNKVMVEKVRDKLKLVRF